MTNRWKELFALAREIEEAIAAGAKVDPEKTRRFARAVLTIEEPPSTNGAPPRRTRSSAP